MTVKSADLSGDFIPAKPNRWFISAAQAYVRAHLAFDNRIQLADEDLNLLRRLPGGAGAVLTPNHADETDPRICLELSRRSGKRFISMCNREAFDEMMGLAGLALQHLGLFSVRRGAHDHPAKLFATDVVKKGEDVLVIFPEGEIFYLNEKIQPFHTGAVDICLEAIAEKRKHVPDWTAYIVPMVIKYHYSESIATELERRIAKMEADLMISRRGETCTYEQRLRRIREVLIRRQERAYDLKLPSLNLQEQTQEIVLTENAILDLIATRYPDTKLSPHSSTIDKVWQLSADIREALSRQPDGKIRTQMTQDLGALKEVAELASWRPEYYVSSASPDRLAEGVIKLERDLYKIHRPRQLATRNVIVKISDPINMGDHVEDYMSDPHIVRHNISRQLHEQMQALIDKLAASAAP